MGPKPKKTKAELDAEREAKEEEERKAAEAEAKRAAIEAEKRRVEAERLAAERKAFREAELARLAEEKAVYLDRLRDRQTQRAAEDAVERSRQEWERYREPTDVPDAASERDMNTFSTLMNEAQANDMAESLELVRRVERVAKAVEDVWSDSLAKQNLAAQTTAHSQLGQFSHLIMDKFDAAAARLLGYVDNHLNDKAEINVEEVVDEAGMGMWGSFAEMRPTYNKKQINFNKLGVQWDVVKQILQQDTRFVHRVVRLPIDTQSMAAYNFTSSSMATAVTAAATVGQTSKYVLGPMFYIDILIPPPQAFQLRAKKWLIRDKSSASQSAKRSAYPSSVPCRLYIEVPTNVIMSDDVRFALWNPETKDWTDEGITDYQYSDSNRIVQFLFANVGILALVKDRRIEFPYKRWSLVPTRSVTAAAGGGAGAKNVYEQQARFTIATQRHEVVIDIKGCMCSLARAFSRAVADLVGVEMTPGSLLNKLQRRGVNLLPSELDTAALAADERVILKDAMLETDVLREIARCANSFEYTSSPWNQQLSPSQIGIVTRESTVYTASEENFDYECVLVELDEVSESFRNSRDVGKLDGVGASSAKFMLVMGNQYGDVKGYSSAPRPGEVSHLELASTLKRRVSPETIERIDRCNELFQETIYQLLRLVRPISLTVV